MKGSRNSCVALIMMGVEYVSGSGLGDEDGASRREVVYRPGKLALSVYGCT